MYANVIGKFALYQAMTILARYLSTVEQNLTPMREKTPVMQHLLSLAGTLLYLDIYHKQSIVIWYPLISQPSCNQQYFDW